MVISHTFQDYCGKVAEVGQICCSNMLLKRVNQTDGKSLKPSCWVGALSGKVFVGLWFAFLLLIKNIVIRSEVLSQVQESAWQG